MAAALVLVVGASLALVAYVRSPPGREALARELEQLVSDGIRGSMTIEGIDSVSEESIVGHGIRFSDESGRVVLEADRVELAVGFAELLSGHVVSPRGRVRGARVVLESLESGGLFIERAFASPHPGPPGQPIGDDVVRLEGLVVSDVEVLVALEDAPEIRARGVSAILLLRVPDHGGLHLRADRLDGALRLATPLPIELSFDDGTLSVDGDSRRRVVIALPANMNGEALGIDVVVRMDRDDEAHIAVHVAPSGIEGAFASAPFWMQGLLGETWTDALDVTVGGP